MPQSVHVNTQFSGCYLRKSEPQEVLWDSKNDAYDFTHNYYGISCVSVSGKKTKKDWVIEALISLTTHQQVPGPTHQ